MTIQWGIGGELERERDSFLFLFSFLKGASVVEKVGELDVAVDGLFEGQMKGIESLPFFFIYFSPFQLAVRWTFDGELLGE